MNAAALYILKEYLNKDLFEYLQAIFEMNRTIIKVSRSRKSKYGDYHFTKGRRHVITVNKDLNRYAFVLTLLHETAHMTAFVRNGFRIQAHGKEWKSEYRELLNIAIKLKAFPDNLTPFILGMINDPKATTHGNYELAKALKQYDDNGENIMFLEEIAGKHDRFIAGNGKTYKILGKVRTRFKCEEMQTRRVYSFSALAEVEVY